MPFSCRKIDVQLFWLNVLKKLIKDVEALSDQKSGLTGNEIVQKTGLPANGALSKILKNLESSGFIRLSNIYGKKDVLYQLADYHTAFDYRFLKDNYGKDEHFRSID